MKMTESSGWTRPTNLYFWIWPKFTTPMNITLTTKKYAGEVSLDRSLASLAPSLRSSKRKKASGMEIRRTQDVKLRFVRFNFGQIQFLRFVVVMIRPNSFGHLHLVMLITLLLFVYYKTIYLIWKIILSKEIKQT